ncbi:adenine nucleotide alpha-hydrolase family protein [Desulfonatronum thiodismutans]|uniref:ATP-dependent sacrificial sulfur transferase LarE n=1 Tax=Desulfonatronum thiodismutans TaxID=159290 RepID=UPI00068F00D8|nr:ATP-dependent sacrificial sulfur transferase LarE [Desulfonatronum thiodismutans]
MTDSSLKAKLQVLRVHLETLQPGLIAVSGGVDSRFLMHVSRLRNLDFQAVHAVGPHQSPLEQDQTRTLLQARNVTPRIVRFDPLGQPEVRSNSRQRCYWCKKALFSNFLELAFTESPRSLLDGTHLDDLAVHRPGQKALQELGVHSPLAQAGLTKADIRQAAAWLGLEAPDQPSRACLLTRFPYDRQVTTADLEAVGRVEDGLSVLGLSRFRFRVTGRERNMLQIHPDESHVLRDQEAYLRDLVVAAGLGPFELAITSRLSGYFDSPAESIAHF